MGEGALVSPSRAKEQLWAIKTWKAANIVLSPLFLRPSGSHPVILAPTHVVHAMFVFRSRVLAAMQECQGILDIVVWKQDTSIR